jgi:hypothetical protein
VIDGLFRKRAFRLRSTLDGRRPGAPPAFNRNTVNDAIARLQELASEHFAKQFARDEFGLAVHQRKGWHAKRGKGRGVDAKKSTFEHWYKLHFNSSRCIYVFWSGRQCEYVGKTGSGGSRPSSHFVKFWFGTVTRIDVYATLGNRALPALECLGIHHFRPRRNKSKAETRKWLRKCPLCGAHKEIQGEMRNIFRLR